MSLRICESNKKNLLGFKVRLWIFVCQKFVLSGNNRIFAYGSAVPLKSLGCKSFACSSVEFVYLFLEFLHQLIKNDFTSTRRTVKIPAFAS